MLHDDLQYLPIELQASLLDMQASGASEDRLNRLILLILADREAKTTSLQMELVKIDTSIKTQIARLGDKLSDDLRTQNGASNQMIVDTLGIVQRMEAATLQLRAEFQKFGEDVSGRITGLEERMGTAESERQSLAEKVDRMEEEVHGVALALRLGRMLELTEDALIRIDAEQRIIWLNAGALSLFGYTAQELLGQKLDILIPERFRHAHKQHIRDFAHSLVSSRRMADRQVVAGRRRDGSEMIVSAAIAREQIGGAITFAVLLRPVEKTAAVAEATLGHQ